MRIAILHYTAPPVVGGVEKVVGDQAAALRTLGHEVTIRDRDAGKLERAAFEAVIVHNIFTMPFDLKWTKELREMAEQWTEVRFINWVHDVAAVNPYYAQLPWEEPQYAMLQRPVPNALCATVSEERRRDYAWAAKLELEAIHVIPNGIALDEVLGLTPRVSKWRMWDEDLVLFHPTRLIRRKNIELGIQVCAALRSAKCRAVYAITGAPDPHQADGMRYFEELLAMAHELEVSDCVRFLGRDGTLSDADVRGMYALADCLFFPSKGEGFGLPLLEALVHRLPVFCSDLPVHREVMGDRGHYFSLKTPSEAIAAQILSWAATASDIGRRRWVWGQHEMVKICQERLEPLLRMANERIL